MSKASIKEGVEMSPISQSGLEKISYLILVVLAFVLPLFMFPFWQMSIESGKVFLVSFCVLAILVLYVINQTKKLSFYLPKNPVFIGLGLFIFAYFLSAVFSGTVFASLLGLGLESFTVFSVVILSLLFFFSSIFIDNREKHLKFYLSLVAAFLLVFVFQVVHIVYGTVTSGQILPWDVFKNGATNLIGKWNDLGVFLGMITIVSLAFLEIFEKKLLPNLFRITLALSLLGLIFINFYSVWVLLAVFSAAIFSYSIVSSKKEEVDNNRSRTRFFTASLVILIISLLFVVFGGNDKYFDRKLDNLSERIGVSSLEVRPSFVSTNNVMQDVLKDDLVFGVGPQNFSYAWLKYRPSAVNYTNFWNNNFSVGHSFITTLVVNGGLLTIISLSLFFLSLLYSFYRAVRFKYEDNTGKNLVFVTLFAVAYLWMNSFVYVSGVVVTGLTFILTGILVSSLTTEGVFGEIKISSNSGTKRSLLLSSILLLVFLLSLSGVVLLGSKIYANINYLRGLEAVNLGDVNRALELVSRSNSFGRTDLYSRTLAELNIAQLNREIRDSNLSSDAIRTSFQKRVTDAVSLGNEAVNKNKLNLINFISLAEIYESLVPFNVSGSYEQARAVYQSGIGIAPTSPVALLGLARLEFANGNDAEALLAVNKAIDLKNDYSDAVFLLAQIETKRGNLSEAIKKVEGISETLPNSPGVWFQLGYLRYQDADYRGARDALLQALRLNSDYSNAKYFLGLSYDKLGVTDEAIRLFDEISKFNPGNQEIPIILSNLKSGKSALSGLSSAESIDIETEPEN